MLNWDAFVDPLYKRITLSDRVAGLVAKPLVQRLRHVRLSNIDSIDMPSIANISRFEHILGVAHLAGQLGLRSKLNDHELLVLDASALLHDWAITSFGHLVEEALQYVGTGFDHEKRLRQVIIQNAEILGADLQIFAGREAGLRAWARGVVGHEEHHLLRDIMDHIDGSGRVGRVIAGDIDIDNIDNVYRMAFHMGLPADYSIPLRLAKSIVDVDGQNSEPIFRVGSEKDILSWKETRREVYSHLMLAERDFVGKAMMLSATVKAYQANELTIEDWKMVDHEFLARLLGSPSKDVCETVQRWMAGELWACTPLYWMKGARPNYPALLKFSEKLSNQMDRYCFAYGIKDKRERVVTANFADGRREVYGSTSDQWLFGVVSSMKKPFSAKDHRMVLEAACGHFGTEVINLSGGFTEKNEQAWLL